MNWQRKGANEQLATSTKEEALSCDKLPLSPGLPPLWSLGDLQMR